MIKILVLQHVPYEPPAAIATWAHERALPLSIIHQYTNDTPLPSMDAFDWLVVMGGPMGVYDDALFPWLADEKRFIRRAIDGGKTVIGICLGAQLIAQALGAAVTKNSHKEIGIFPIRILPPAAAYDSIFRDIPESFPAFHWHGDTFDVPNGALPFAANAACENQGFVVEHRIFAFLFHIEATKESVGILMDAGADELHEIGEWIMKREDIEAFSAQDFFEMNGKLVGMLDTLMARWLIARG